MTTIAKGRNIITLINVFTVEPENQQRLLDLLIEATETVVKNQPGYISANFHKSLDGVRVTNYAQWQSREAFEIAFRNPEVLTHTQKALEFASVDYHLYEVAYVDEAH